METFSFFHHINRLIRVPDPKITENFRPGAGVLALSLPILKKKEAITIPTHHMPDGFSVLVLPFAAQAINSGVSGGLGFPACYRGGIEGNPGAKGSAVIW